MFEGIPLCSLNLGLTYCLIQTPTGFGGWPPTCQLQPSETSTFTAPAECPKQDRKTIQRCDAESLRHPITESTRVTDIESLRH